MAFKTKISVCLKNGCKTLKITDTTGVYNASSNPEGWEDASTVAGSEVQSATIKIESPGGGEETIDVTSQIPDPVIGNFDFNDIPASNGSTYADGYYKFTYTIVTDPGANNPGTYKTTLCVYFTCNSECYVNGLWAEVAKDLCCDSCNAPTTREEAQIAEGFLSAIKSAAACGDIDTADKLVAKLNQISNFNDCNC